MDNWAKHCIRNPHFKYSVHNPTDFDRPIEYPPLQVPYDTTSCFYHRHRKKPSLRSLINIGQTAQHRDHRFGHGRNLQRPWHQTHYLSNALKQCPPTTYFYLSMPTTSSLTNTKEFITTYQTHYNNQLVYGGEQNLGMYSFDDIRYFFNYPIKKTRYKYLNSGTIMGPINKGLELFNNIGLNAANKSDQMDSIRYFTKHPNALTIDTNHYLFAVNGGRAGLESIDYTIKNNRLFSTPTQTWPALLHVPGKFFIGLDAIAHELGCMPIIPTYSANETKRFKTTQKEHQLCNKLDIENYIHRLIKNWTINLAILGIVIVLIRFIMGLLN